MKNLFAQVWKFAAQHKMFSEKEYILIALSGGPDSVALTSLLLEIKNNYYPALKLHLAHLNHQLRDKESDQEELFVKTFAEKINLQATTHRINVADLSKGANIEAVAREVRYKFLQDTAQQIGASCIATAHNMNDQAETFLMRLIRGAGITGLTGIKPVLKVNQSPTFPNPVPIVRPLLNTLRRDIESYLKEKALVACIDSSNLLTKFTRNKVRLEILPKILEINPNAIEAIARSTNMLSDWQEVLLDKPEKIFLEKEFRISIEYLQSLPPIMRHQKLRDNIEQINGKTLGLTTKHLFSIDSLLLPGKSGKKVLLPNNLEVAREFNDIIIRSTNLTSSNADKYNGLSNFELLLDGEWQGELFTLFYKEKNKVPYNNYIKDLFAIVDLDKTGEKLKIRFRQPGDKYIPLGHQKEEKVKRLMLEKRIPLSQRELWPIVTTLTDEFIWSPHLPIATKFVANCKSSRFAIISAK